MATGWWAEKVITAAAMTATAAMAAPSVSLSSTITTTPMAATAAMPSPSVLAEVVVDATPMTATAEMAAPTLSYGSSIDVSAMTATAAMPAPVVSSSQSVTTTPMAATAAMPAPGVSVTIGVTPMAATAAMPDVTVKKLVSHTWSGTTLGPFATSKWQGNSANNAGLSSGDISVSGGIAREGSSSANNGTYWSGRCHETPMGTVLHFAQVTLPSSLTGLDRGQGCGVGGSDSSFTNGVFLIVDTAANATALQIFSKVGNTVTPRVTVNNPNVTSGGTIALQITWNGSNYVYTAFENGVSTGSSWSDTGGVITPGLWTTPAFERTYAAGQFGSEGLAAFAAADN